LCQHRRGHGGLYDALAAGRVDIARLRRALATVPLPRAAEGRLVLAADITCWLRPDAHTSPQRILCHTYGRGKDQHIPAPGWPYSVICALEAGRSSWTAPLDALRLAPGDDAATVTARQMRELIERLMEAGQWNDDDPDVLIVVDAGYDVPRLAHLLKDLPVQVLGRMRSDRVSPQIVTGMRQALSIAIILMVISEMFAASNGLGFTTVQFQRSFAIPEMWSGVLLLGLLGFALSLLFRFAENRVLAWYHGLRRAQRNP
jgi:hypothetical protein